MSCLVCKREVRIAAKGLCGACYQRQQKNGTTGYVRRKGSPPCTVDGCSDEAHAKGMCFKHYQRYLKHGHVDETRSDSWGALRKHPLFYSWMHLNRKGAVVHPAWKGDFLQFAADVGDRPSENHRLFPKDPGYPLGPDNFYWREMLTRKQEGETLREAKNRYHREYRKAHPEQFRRRDVKKRFGLGADAYLNMVEQQDGRCAICGMEESAVINGRRITLAIDHDHDTKAVRGLLCLKCNRALGLFQDSMPILEKAIAYLAKHQA